METIFDTWNVDPAKDRQSILFQDSGTSDNTVQNLIDTWFTSPSISTPSDNAVSNDSFWTAASGYVKDIQHFLGFPTTDDIKQQANQAIVDHGTITASDVYKINTGQQSIIGQTVSNISNKAISFIQSGLFKAIAFIAIAVILFFLAKGFITAKGGGIANA